MANSVSGVVSGWGHFGVNIVQDIYGALPLLSIFVDSFPFIRLYNNLILLLC